MSNTFFIDGQEISFTPGQTIMDAALAVGIYIPHLCHKPGLTPQGSCKLCTVDVDGRSASACTLPASNGMQVANNTPALNAVRKTLTQMLFVEGNHLCPTCMKSGDCILQALGYHFGMLDGHFPPFYPLREVDASHPDLLLDRDRCVVCALCVRASRELDGKNVFAIGRRGANARLIVNTPSGKLGDSDLTLDDAAAHICPVGAILPKNHGHEVPIGLRTFDLHSVAESDVVTPVTLKKTEHHDA